MNEDHHFSHHDPTTLQQLQRLLPPRRCGLDGRVPVNETRLPCGHVYCKVCVDDIAATAALLGQVPACKLCNTEFRWPATTAPTGNGLPNLDEVRASNGLPTGTASEYPNPPELIHPGSFGERAQTALWGPPPAQALPWSPPSQSVDLLREQYTRPEQAGSLPPGQGQQSYNTAFQQLNGPPPSHQSVQQAASLQTGDSSQQPDCWPGTGQQQDHLGEDFDFNFGLDFDQYIDYGLGSVPLDISANDNGIGQSVPDFNSPFAGPSSYTPQSQYLQPPQVDQLSASAPTSHNLWAQSMTTQQGRQSSSNGYCINNTMFASPAMPQLQGLPHCSAQLSEPPVDPKLINPFSTGLTQPPSPAYTPQPIVSQGLPMLQPKPQAQQTSQVQYGQSFASQSPAFVQHPLTPGERPYTPRTTYTPSAQRDISVLAGLRFCFKGTLPNQATMEQAVRDNGGVVTNGGFKHTTHGVVGPGWKPGPSWERNGIQVLDEDAFWVLLESRRRAREREKSGS